MSNKTDRTMFYLRVLLAVVGMVVVIFHFTNYGEKLGQPLMEFFTTDFYAETGAKNAVAGIYLNYRMFDTLFEALMLMVSVMEVINVSWANKHEEVYRFQTDFFHYKNNSELINRMVGIVYPFVVLIGLYVILNGHVSPGGGFQGGTILATALITRYLVYPNFDINLDVIEKIEKIIFVFILIVPVTYVFMELFPTNDFLNETYMTTMNTLIGFKVFCGLSIIFYRFVFFEGASAND